MRQKPSTAIGLGVRGLVVCVLVVVSSLDVCAQSASTGALKGIVTDPTGAVLQSAAISLRNKGTGETRTAITDQDGSYRLSLLPPGEYELTARAVGFATAICLSVNQFAAGAQDWRCLKAGPTVCGQTGCVSRAVITRPRRTPSPLRDAH
jgi:hypothetical protein